jgi:hypothetical protein
MFPSGCRAVFEPSEGATPEGSRRASRLPESASKMINLCHARRLLCLSQIMSHRLYNGKPRKSRVTTRTLTRRMIDSLTVIKKDDVLFTW